MTRWSAPALVAASRLVADPGRMVRLARTWTSEREFLDAPVERVAEALGLDVERSGRLVADVGQAGPHILDEIGAVGVSAVAFGDCAYPTLLATCPHAPPLLYVRGDRDALRSRAVAIVGSRRSTAYGRAVAEAAAGVAADAGLTVVSGGAIGIDSAAHEGALEHGDTVAILGCGLDRPYPPRNRELFDRIAGTGAVISEFPLGMDPRAHHFPQRNRVIAGMTECTVVVEASMRSGALITAGYAADLGREVMAVPGQIWAVQSAGCLALIRDGAIPMTDPSDVLERFGLEALPPPRAALSDDELELVDLMAQGVDTFDELVETAGLGAGECLAALSALELAGVVRRDTGGALVLCATVS